jgi:hypothetical protein
VLLVVAVEDIEALVKLEVLVVEQKTTKTLHELVLLVTLVLILL